MKEHVDINKEMEVFDQLPPRVRKALNDGPVKYVGMDSLRWIIKHDDVDRIAKLIRAGKLPARKVEMDCN